MRSPIATLLLVCIWLPGCSMIGLDAQKSFSCKAPPGIGCSLNPGHRLSGITPPVWYWQWRQAVNYYG